MSNEYKSEVGNTQGGLMKGPIFFIIIALLVGAGSFGLGRLTKADESEPVQIQGATAVNHQESANSPESAAIEQAPAQSEKAPLDPTAGKYVASKSGEKYFSLTCSGAKNIKEANRVYFASVDEAKAAGYTPSATCKDLN